MAAAPRRLVDKALNALVQRPGQQLIILSQVLVDDVNTGYQQFQNLQVLRVNGAPVHNLRQLKRLLSNPKGAPFLKLEMEDDRVIVLDAALLADATERIQRRYRVPYLMSADLAEEDGEGEEETEGEVEDGDGAAAAAGNGAPA